MTGTNTLSQAAQGAPSDYVTATIDGQVFGIPVAVIQDVFAPRDLTRVPLSPAEVCGLLNLRGRIVTAIDVRARLGLPPRREDAAIMAVGIDRDGEVYGLIVDEVGEVLSLGDKDIDANPVNLDERWAGVSRGVSRLENSLLVILDVNEVLSLSAVAKAA